MISLGGGRGAVQRGGACPWSVPSRPCQGVWEESTMAQESPKSSAAEIPVTSNGEVDDSHEHGFNRVVRRKFHPVKEQALGMSGG